MRIAIHNPFYGGLFAEKELCRRLGLAAKSLGWKAVEVAGRSEINELQPDAVLVLHHYVPKVTGYPTYGCMWNPIAHFERSNKSNELIKNILSYDGYLCGSSVVKTWVQDTLYFLPNKVGTLPFYPSSNETQYREPELAEPRLVYIGSNWDTVRFKDLFLELDKKDYVDFYGRQEGWQYLESSYRGSIPFDGVSLLDKLNRAGVALCLHTEVHTESEAPTMRIFEIAASGALAICGEHAFIRENFGDCVLYLSQNLSLSEQVEEISSHIAWIKNNPETALEMSREAHRIFVERFSLENLLRSFKDYHQEIVLEKGFAPSLGVQAAVTKQPKHVQLILRANSHSASEFKQHLDSLANQSYQDFSLVLVKSDADSELDALLELYKTRFEIKIIALDSVQCRYGSSTLWAGLSAVTSEYFGVLSSSLLHRNHIHTLVKLLERYENFGLAYSGSVLAQEVNTDDCNSSQKDFDEQNGADVTSLRFFEQADLVDAIESDKLLGLGSFIAKSSLLQDSDIAIDPKLEVAEEFFLLLYLTTKTRLVFSYDVTQSHDQPVSEDSTPEGQIWQKAIRRIEKIMSSQGFPFRISFARWHSLLKAEAELLEREQELQKQKEEAKRFWQKFRSSQQELQRCQEELQNSQATVAELQSSKFWKLRETWLRLKRVRS
ncbi:hypothetical protein [Leptolyngbya sp. FACHB-261]|uniref:glycosyltransferase family protein n=1 Tax=Leptolyngbya sp. FACHB-261 TaxID=2692806 RepID=UPI00168696A9|nr:hypothetical protein [Leptolyngbya sp. FACHB-261]MBD2103184.1 hypothetical protein [Leptolyngbya sp. FACHB-261]